MFVRVFPLTVTGWSSPGPNLIFLSLLSLLMGLHVSELRSTFIYLRNFKVGCHVFLFQSLSPSPSSSSILRLHVQSSLPLHPCSLDKKGEHVSVAFPEPKKRVCNSLARPFTRPLFSRFFWMTHKARRREGGGGIGGELENSARCATRPEGENANGEEGIERDAWLLLGSYRS